MIHGWTQVRVIVQHRAPGSADWIQIPSSMLTDPLQESDWRRLRELRINILGDRQNMAGVATNAAELRELMEKIVGKRPQSAPYDVAKRIEEESAQAPSLRRSIHFDRETGTENKSLKPYEETQRQPVA